MRLDLIGSDEVGTDAKTHVGRFLLSLNGCSLFRRTHHKMPCDAGAPLPRRQAAGYCRPWELISRFGDFDLGHSPQDCPTSTTANRPGAMGLPLPEGSITLLRIPGVMRARPIGNRCAVGRLGLAPESWRQPSHQLIGPEVGGTYKAGRRCTV